MKPLLIGILCILGSLCARGQSPETGLAIDESLCRIQVTADAITPILEIENHRAVGLAHVRVELLDPADSVRASGEIDTQLRPGSNRVRVDLRGWTQKSQEWNDSIWYRVRYRVSVPGSPSPAAEGILALSTKADGVFDLRVVVSKRVIAGEPYRVRVYTQSLADLRPVSGVQVQAELESEDEGGKLKLTSTTDAHGYAQLEFNFPAQSWGESGTLKVVASKGQIVREAEDDNVYFGVHWRFFTTTDKPLYQPGQTVHVRALLLDDGKHALANTPVTVTIVDEENTLAFRTSAQTSRFGVVRADWEIPDNLRLGDFLGQSKRQDDLLSSFQHRQDIPRRILEPRDRRPIPARNPARVCLQVGFVIDFKSDAALAQFIHSFFYTVYGKIEDGEGSGLVIGFRVHQSLGAPGKGHDQGTFRTAGKF